MTPKQFIEAFVTAEDDAISFRRRDWGSKSGWPSTLDMIRQIKKQVNKTQKGQARWCEFIKNEAIQIFDKERPPTGNYPGGCFQSSQTVEPSFFDDDAVRTREELLTQFNHFVLRNGYDTRVCSFWSQACPALRAFDGEAEQASHFGLPAHFSHPNTSIVVLSLQSPYLVQTDCDGGVPPAITLFSILHT
ncbi:hypothetical protein PGTUg99_024676 [Puccinia graminis f. sp. tritici]|uniref:Uncharacterized protein n=1 Tax=Puccinia graminis f. sp. tritici TaxID=56615 RepID=A0A5B0Q3Y2_PUCGR|nr:hypothetical protein PGTUg99_024676 [Puccinia graminis f. sp. tritici]